MNNTRIFALLSSRHIAITQNFRKRPDRGHRRAQFMADLTEERVFLHRQSRQLLVGITQGTRGAVLLCGFGFKLVGIFQNLGGLVGHGNQVLNRHTTTVG